MSARWLVGPAALALLGLLIGSTAAAELPTAGRKTYPLKYRLGQHGYAGRSAELSVEKVELKSEPKYRAKEPLYATFRLGVKEHPFNVVLDYLDEEDEGYHLLYVDADGDGRITPEEKITGASHSSTATIFGPIKCTLHSEEGTYAQWFWFELIHIQREGDAPPDRTLRIGNAGQAQATLSFGDQQRQVAFVDVNGNGRYNDYLQGTHAGDRVLIARGKRHGNDDHDLSLSRYLQIDERYWLLDVAPDGSSVAVTPLNTPLGTLQAELPEFTMYLDGAFGTLELNASKGSVTVPIGEYRVRNYEYTLTDKTEKRWEFSARTDDEGTLLRVPAQGTVKLAFGAPLVPKVVVEQQDGELRLNLKLRGVGGEIYDSVNTNWHGATGPPPKPKVRILDANGRELALLDFHYG